MEVYRSTHSLGNGYYMKKIEWFEGGWGMKGLERHYDPQGAYTPRNTEMKAFMRRGDGTTGMEN